MSRSCVENAAILICGDKSVSAVACNEQYIFRQFTWEVYPIKIHKDRHEEQIWVLLLCVMYLISK